MAFLPVLLPLLVLAWHSLNIPGEQSIRASRTNLVDARCSEMMTAMERSFRQFCILDNAKPARVYQNQRQRYDTFFLQDQADVVAQPSLTDPLRETPYGLAVLDCKSHAPSQPATERLKAFAGYNSQSAQATRSVIADRAAALQKQIIHSGQFFWLAGADPLFGQPDVSPVVQTYDY